MNEKTSPLPWSAEEVGVDEWFLVRHDGKDGWDRIAEVGTRADIDLIVRAVNAHEALVDIVEDIAAEPCYENPGEYPNKAEGESGKAPCRSCRARAALQGKP